MDGIKHEGELDPNHVYQCSMCGDLVSFMEIPYITPELRIGTAAVRHQETTYPLCKGAHVERLWPDA